MSDKTQKLAVLAQLAIATAQQRATQTIKGEPGRDADPAEMHAAVQAAVQAAVARIPRPRDGRDADPAKMHAAIHAAVQAEVSRIPRPRDGRDADPAQMHAAIQAAVQAAVAEIPVPQNGRDADPAMLQAAVQAEVAKLPRPAPAPTWGTWRGPWRQDERYSEGDIVTCDNGTWRCKVVSTRQRPRRDSSDWDVLAAPGEPGISLPGTPGTIANVVHGAVAQTPRPNIGAGPVTWIGSVEPLNAQDNDIWIDTA